MKKLALAPAVALAITGLGAAPVFAAPSGSLDLQVVHGVPGEKATTDNVGPQEAINAAVTVSPEKLTQSELVDPGVTFTVTGLQAGDVVTDSLTGESVTAEGDTVQFTIVNSSGDPTAIEPGIVEATVTISREGEDDQVLDTQFEVIADGDEAPTVDPQVSLGVDELTVSEFNEKGIAVTGEGFTPNGKVTLWGGSAQSPFFQAELTADAEGKITGTVKAPEGGLEPGEYSVWAVDADSEAASPHAAFVLTEDKTEEPTEDPEDPTEDPAPPAVEASLAVSPETVSPADFVKADKGVTLAVENCEPGSDVNFVVNPKGATNVTAYENTVQADDEGKASVNVYGTSASDPSAYIGDYEVTVTCGDDEMTGKFSVSDDANAGGSDGNEGGTGGDDNGAGDGGSELPRTGAELTGLAAGVALLLVGGAAVTMTVRRKKAAQSPSEF